MSVAKTSGHKRPRPTAF